MGLTPWLGSSELSESSELVCYHHHHQSNGDRDSQDGGARTNQYKYILDKYNTELGFVITVSFQPYKALQIQGLSTIFRGESEDWCGV